MKEDFADSRDLVYDRAYEIYNGSSFGRVFIRTATGELVPLDVACRSAIAAGEAQFLIDLKHIDPAVRMRCAELLSLMVESRPELNTFFAQQADNDPDETVAKHIRRLLE